MSIEFSQKSQDLYNLIQMTLQNFPEVSFEEAWRHHTTGIPLFADDVKAPRNAEFTKESERQYEVICQVQQDRGLSSFSEALEIVFQEDLMKG